MASLLHSWSDEVLDLEPGRTFGERFEIVRELDRDEWSRRYFAVDKQLGARALMRVAAGASDSAAVMLEAAERIAGLRHAKVLPILGSGHERDVVYVAHSHVSGERLEERIVTRPLPLREFVPIASQLLMPVSQAHQHGIGVGPVRPQDVLLRVRDGHSLVVELSDFGMGVVFGPLGGSTTPADDVARLGRLFAQMLTAELPSDLDPGGWWATRRLPDDIPVGLRTMIGMALGGDERFTDAQALVERMIDVLPPALFKLPLAEPASDATTTGRRRAESSGKLAASENAANSRNHSNGRMRPVVAAPGDSAPFQPAVPTPHPAVVVRPESARAGWVWFAGVFLVAGMGIGSWIWWKTNAPPTSGAVEVATGTEPVAAVAIEPAERLRPIQPAEPEEAEPEPQHADDSQAAEVIELGRLIIAASSGAEILIDDEAMGNTPYLGDLPVGRHEVRIVRGGVQLWSKTVDIEAGQTHRFEVNLASSSGSSPRRQSRDRPASRDDQAPDNSDEASSQRSAPAVEAEPRTPPDEPVRSGPFLQPSRRAGGSDPFLPPSE